MKNKLVVLNHKMNLLYDDIYKYIQDINQIETDNDIIVLRRSLYLEAFVNNCSWGVGCQNFYYELEGDYTGEISTNQLRSLGVEYAMIGHYERKKYFKESMEDVRKKLETCLEANIMPILCLGDNGSCDWEKVIKEQLDCYLKNIAHIEFITFAFEPEEALESDHEYDLERLEEVVNYIADYLENKYKVVPKILYGGNVNEKNVKNILHISKLSGIIIGTSSISASIVKNIVSSIE